MPIPSPSTPPPATPAVDAWELTAAAHAALSPVNVEFRELARRDPACLSSALFRDDSYKSLMPFGRQLWPLFVSHAVRAELAAAILAVNQLLRGVPERVFDNDAGRIAACFGVDRTFVQIALGRPNGIAEALARGDFVLGAEGFQCVELNVASNLGGWETRMLAELVLEVPPVRRFLEGLGRRVTFSDTFRLLVRYIARDVLQAGLARGGEINVALAFPDGHAMDQEAQFHAYLTREYAEALRGISLTGGLRLCTPAAFTVRQGALWHGGSRVHAVIDYGSEAFDLSIFRCFKSGALRLYNAPGAGLLGDKRSLALLSEHAESEAFTAEERQQIERYVPWTRRMVPGTVRYAGERQDLARLVLVQQEEMVLKRALSYGGEHVMLGCAAAPAEWESAVRRAFDSGDWIVQRRVVSQPLLFQDGEYGCSLHDTVWGPFVFGSTYAGSILRVRPQAEGGVVNLTQGATEALLFEVADPPPV